MEVDGKVGILGNQWQPGQVDIINCKNNGNSGGGIVGLLFGGTVNIYNCYNLGNCTSGLLGEINWGDKIEIKNCYNAGVGDKAIIGKNSSGTIEINIANTYYDQTKLTSVGAVTEGIEALNEEGIKNNETFVERLNNNIENDIEWKQWKIGEDGYPTFE